ncbi:hypothetical protein AVDCRST_MAG92-3704 [uncultured Coleofasciculus sp.]|uniref:Uncharacterized protein n=1 Tax=uncultured Coleofasciculus sp. TaxID=1267456 RepID=A0A6J4JMF0_9CYAN|nr:hypothetical protein AVDCRST_MAG92-3704 [uncultured Coleofasciculus sp.]
MSHLSEADWQQRQALLNDVHFLFAKSLAKPVQFTVKRSRLTLNSLEPVHQRLCCLSKEASLVGSEKPEKSIT